MQPIMPGQPPADIQVQADQLADIHVEAVLQQPPAAPAAPGSPTEWIVKDLLGNDLNKRNTIESVVPEIINEGGQIVFGEYQPFNSDGRTLSADKCIKMEIKWTVTFKNGAPPATRILPVYTLTKVPDLNDPKAEAAADLAMNKVLKAFSHVHRAANDLSYAQGNKATDLFNAGASILENGRVRVRQEDEKEPDAESEAKIDRPFTASYGKNHIKFDLPAMQGLHTLIKATGNQGKIYLGPELPTQGPGSTALALVDEKWIPFINPPAFSQQHGKIREALQKDASQITGAYLNSAGIPFKSYLERLQNELTAQQDAFNELEKGASVTTSVFGKSFTHMVPEKLQRSFLKSPPASKAFQKTEAALIAKIDQLTQKVTAQQQQIQDVEGRPPVNEQMLKKMRATLTDHQGQLRKAHSDLAELKKQHQNETQTFLSNVRIMEHLQQSIQRHTQQLIKLSQDPGLQDPSLAEDKEKIVKQIPGLEKSLASNKKIVGDLTVLQQAENDLANTSDVNIFKERSLQAAAQVTLLNQKLQNAQTNATQAIAQLTPLHAQVNAALDDPVNLATEWKTYKETKARYDGYTTQYRDAYEELHVLHEKLKEAQAMFTRLGEPSPSQLAPAIAGLATTLTEASTNFLTTLGDQDHQALALEKKVSAVLNPAEHPPAAAQPPQQHPPAAQL